MSLDKEADSFSDKKEELLLLATRPEVAGSDIASFRQDVENATRAALGARVDASDKAQELSFRILFVVAAAIVGSWMYFDIKIEGKIRDISLRVDSLYEHMTAEPRQLSEKKS